MSNPKKRARKSAESIEEQIQIHNKKIIEGKKKNLPECVIKYWKEEIDKLKLRQEHYRRKIKR